jgi:hypothetical protein
VALVLYSVIRRHMKATGRYVEAKAGVQCPVADYTRPGEELLGWYQNPEPWHASFIVFTDKAIYSVEGLEIVRIGLTDLVGYEMPEKRVDVGGVRVRTRDGFRFLRIAGSHGPSGAQTGALERVGLGGHLQSDAMDLVQVLRVVAEENA